MDKLPPKVYTMVENHQWAEARLAELMAEFHVTRDEVINITQAHAPAMAEWLEVE
jgi:hypothetical protein